MESKYESRVTSHEPSPLIKGLGESRIRAGSALILVVVLTSLLAIVGVMFVMVARVDRIATSAISENKTLDSAVEMVIARISQELVLDVPRLGQEYYDYPDANNAWLASLEPYDANPAPSDYDYYWQQISDVTGFLKRESYAAQNVEVELPDSQRPKSSEKWVRDYPEIRVNSDGKFLDKNGDETADGLWADADGDGVADSKWIELEGINSSKGKTIFAAVRVIDNGAMLNVNTAYKFDPNVGPTNANLIDGSRLAQIHMLDFVKGVLDDVDDLHRFRCDGSEPDLLTFNDECAIRIENPDRTTINYLPYDISDELELRNRFVLDMQYNTTRIEAALPKTLPYYLGNQYRNRFAPIDTSDDFSDWEEIMDPFDPDEDYNFRHLLTAYNFDRIINPYGGKMVNVNRDGAGLIYSAIKLALFTADPNFKDVDRVAAQTAVNLIDFRDNDSEVTPLPDVNGITYYGFERPCVYISEVAHKFEIPPGGPIGAEIRGYAVELYKPYFEDSDPDNWRLVISGPPPPGGPIGAPIGRPRKEEYDIDWSGSEQFHVIRNDPHKILPEIDSDAVVEDSGALVFSKGDLIELQRRVDDAEDIWITVDSIEVTGWLVPVPPVVGTRSFKRDINRHKCIRRLWDSDADEEALTLGRDNIYTDPNSRMIQAHPENRPFTNVGEIGMVFREDAYGEIWNSTDTTEADVRINLADTDYHSLFQYLTVFDPVGDFIDNDGDGLGIDSDSNGILDVNEIDADELKIPGRININTAPWYVIAQLPWMRPEIAQAVVLYRDDTPGIDGFESIGELMQVPEMYYYADDSSDLDGFPDLTPGGSTADGAEDDFEERDVIFARISNLVTVRSDVFTAYMLVRIGADGPQKRVMAILDRSNVYSGSGRVRLVALHPVADPR